MSKIKEVVTNPIFENNPNPGDDGWWIDEVQIAETLDTPALLSRDDDPPPGTPTCAAIGCTSITAQLDSDPPSPLPTPGVSTTLTAGTTTNSAQQPSRVSPRIPYRAHS